MKSLPCVPDFAGYGDGKPRVLDHALPSQRVLESRRNLRDRSPIERAHSIRVCTADGVRSSALGYSAGAVLNRLGAADDDGRGTASLSTSTIKSA
jgi:hypothetical protein